MQHPFDRRKFIKAGLISGASLTTGWPKHSPRAIRRRIGIIGLDTSHSVAFTKEINSNKYPGFSVVAAHPKGSADIESAVSRIGGYTEDVKKLGVEICNSVQDLLKKCDVVLLETNDGRIHLEQALQVFKARKPVFIDKPVAASLKDAIKIYGAADQAGVPVFSSSALRFMENVQAVVNGKIGKVIGADTYSPATIEKTHPDLFWYGIHGIETLCTVMGTGCKTVSRTYTPETDLVVGTWNDGRIGSFRGTRSGKADFGGTAYGETGNQPLGPFADYTPLLNQIIAFFETGKPPVTSEQTLEILAIMEAADESRKQNGAGIELETIFARARGK